MAGSEKLETENKKPKTRNKERETVLHEGLVFGVKKGIHGDFALNQSTVV